MRKIIRGTLATVATTLIVSSVVYAATISGVATQTINSGDIMHEGWYQQVNDFVKAGKSSSTSATSRIVENQWNSGMYSCSDGGGTMPGISVSCNANEVVSSCTISNYDGLGPNPTSISGKTCTTSGVPFKGGGGACGYKLIAVCLLF